VLVFLIPQIFDRMSAETRDSPRQAALAWQQKQEALQASKEVGDAADIRQ